jgi:hypothetical protein
MSDTTYFLRSRGKTLGPFTLDRLRAMKSRGQLGRTHQVSTDRQTWVAAGTLTELFAPEAAPVEFEPDTGAAAPAAGPAGAATPSAPVAAWFYHAGGQQYGPVPATEIRRLLSAGDLSPDDMVWREGLENWLAIAKVPELSPRSAAAGGRAARARRSPAAVTAMCLALAPWPLYALGVLAFAVAAASAKHRSLTPDDLFGVVVGGAILSFALNVSWFVLSTLAVIFGGVALAQVSNPDNRLSGYGMAVTGLVLGIVNAVLLFLWIPIAMALSGK